MVTRKKTRIRKYKTLKKNKLNNKKTKRKVKKTRIKRKKYNLKGGSHVSLFCDDHKTNSNKINKKYYNFEDNKKVNYNFEDNKKGGYSKGLKFHEIIFLSTHNTLIQPNKTTPDPKSLQKTTRALVNWQKAQKAILKQNESVNKKLINKFLECSYQKCACLEIDIWNCKECNGCDTDFSCKVRHVSSNEISLTDVFQEIKDFYTFVPIIRELSNTEFPPLIIDFDTTAINLFLYLWPSRAKKNYKKLFQIAKNIIGGGIQTKYQEKIPLQYLPFPKNIYLRCSRFLEGNAPQFPLLKGENTKSYKYKDFIKKAKKNDTELSSVITRAYPGGKINIETFLELIVYGCNIPAIDFYEDTDVMIVYYALFRDIAFLKTGPPETVVKKGTRISFNFNEDDILKYKLKIFFWYSISNNPVKLEKKEYSVNNTEVTIDYDDLYMFPLLYFELTKIETVIGGSNYNLKNNNQSDNICKAALRIDIGTNIEQIYFNNPKELFSLIYINITEFKVTFKKMTP